MADINKVIIVGRLTRDAEQSYTQSGTPLLKFSIACNRRRKQGDQWVDEASFFDVVAFGKQGETISQYMTKGRQVCIDGQLRQDRWEAQDGSKRSKVYVDANYVQLLGDSHGVNRDSQGRDAAAPTPGSTPQTMGGPPSFDDDVPF